VEALGNSRKHAAATEAALALSCADGEVTLRVVDNGKGFNTGELSEGSGLQHMADRMAAVGGSLSVLSDSNAGTAVVALAPLGAPVGQYLHISGRPTTPASTAGQPAPAG
jgi:signal transduction histidine kinase